MNNILNSELTKKLESYFFTFLLFELFLGGSGRIFSFGFVSLRMVLFSIALIWFSIRFLYESKDKFIFRVVIYFTFILVTGVIVGHLNNAPKNLIFIDIKQLLFFFSIICFSICIKTKEQIKKVITTIKISTIILAISYLICYSLIQLNIIEMKPFYNCLSVKWLHNEFMFRGMDGNFFYKGFFYLGIGIFFFLFSKPSFKNGLITLIIYVALFLTLLRWLLAITIIVFASSIFFNWAINKFKLAYLKSKEMVFHLLLILTMTITPIIFKDFYITSLGNKQESVDIRKQQIEEVKSEIFENKNSLTLEKKKEIKPLNDKNIKNINNITLKDTTLEKLNNNIKNLKDLETEKSNSDIKNLKYKTKEKSKFNILVGKGLGIGVPIRPVHMELTYLEIFFKQGLLGLSFWLFILLYCIYKFKLAIKNKIDLNDILPWLTGVFIVYLQSITNPLLVNSIGMSFVIIAMIILRNQALITQNHTELSNN